MIPETTLCLLAVRAAYLPLASEWLASGTCFPFIILPIDDWAASLTLADQQQLDVTTTDGTSTLSAALSAEDRPTRCRVVWVRDSHCDDLAAMEGLESYLQATLPSAVTKVWIDLVVPQGPEDRRVPSPRAEWYQCFVAPSDRADVASADAGWTEPAATAMHTALAVMGVLGGLCCAVNPGRTGVTFIHAFSRVIDGGREAAVAAYEFVHHTLPSLSAAEVEPARFYAPKDESALVESALGWLIESHPGTLSYTRPAPVALAAAPRVSVGTHLRIVLAALGLVAFPHRSLPVAAEAQGQRPRTRAKSSSEQKDLGYEIGGEAAVATDHFEDFARIDADFVARISDQLQLAGHNGGEPPAAGVWLDAIDLSLGLTDGGELPSAYTPELYLERRPVVEPRWAVALEKEAEASGPVHPILSDRMPAALAAEATKAAMAVLQGTPEPFDATDPTLSTVGRGLAQTTNDRDATARRDQFLESQVVARNDLPLISRLLRRLGRDWLLAELDAARWQDLALRPDDFTWPDLAAALRRTRSRIGGWAALAAALSAALYLAFPTLHDWLQRQLSWDIQQWWGHSLNAAVLIGVAAWAVRSFFRLHRRALERARRLREVRGHLGRWAVLARKEADRLEHAVRIQGLWRRILGNLVRPVEGEAPPTWPSVSRLPKSARRFRPVDDIGAFCEARLPTVLAKPGWRQRQLAQLATQVVDGETARDSDPGDPSPLSGERHLPDAVAKDPGMPGGVLTRLAGEAERETRLREVFANLTRAGTQQAKEALGAKTQLVLRNPPRSGSGKSDTAITIEAAFGAIDKMERELPLEMPEDISPQETLWFATSPAPLALAPALIASHITAIAVLTENRGRHPAPPSTGRDGSPGSDGIPAPDDEDSTLYG